MSLFLALFGPDGSTMSVHWGKAEGVLLHLYLAPSAPLLRMSDVGLVREGKVRIDVAIVATAGSRRQTLFIGIEAAIPCRSYVTLPLDAERIVSGENRSRFHPDGCHGDKSGDRQEQFTHHSLLDGSPRRNGTPPGSKPATRADIFGWDSPLPVFLVRTQSKTPAVSRRGFLSGR